MSQVAHQARAYPAFCSIRQLGVFLLPPGWDAGPSQGYPQALSLPVPIDTPGWREALWELSVLPKTLGQGLKMDCSIRWGHKPGGHHAFIHYNLLQ